MNTTSLIRNVLIILIVLFVHDFGVAQDRKPSFRFQESENGVEILAGDQSIAIYQFKNSEVTRPYFYQVKTLHGTQVTRKYPPDESELQDHPHYHPGIFLAFGDLSQNDNWRLKAKVVHDRFLKNPANDSFTVLNRYLAADGKTTICTEKCEYVFSLMENGYLLECNSEFESDAADFSFGDQEEMGLGIRLTLGLTEKEGTGRILNNHGLLSAKKTWGQEAAWCDYSGQKGNHQVGVMLMASPKNSRPTWWHNRDYGLFVANMFGRKAMHQGDESRITIPNGKTFQMGYAIYVHESTDLDKAMLDQIYSQYSKQ